MSLKMPGGAIANRPLHFIWIVDTSGSMSYDGKIQALNNAIREAIPHMRDAADENPNAQVFVRSITFATGAQWNVPKATPVEQFEWQDVRADGVTDLGNALFMVADQLRVPPMESRALPPVLVLLSDGQPTDEFDAGLAALMKEPWGQKAVRVAIAIGADADHESLQKFIGSNQLRPLRANNPEALIRHIKWASTAVLKAASTPVAMPEAAPPPAPAPAPQAAAPAPAPAPQPAWQPVAIPAPPPSPMADADVW
ncbi:MAG: VWA domain-containing protein [Armatimonadetes bacterium]|nr:VWA domain-containing protein [Armatimonadota bacterium]